MIKILSASSSDATAVSEETAHCSLITSLISPGQRFLSAAHLLQS